MQPLNRRKFVVLTGGALSISGCLDETDEGETDDSDVATDDEESTGDQPEPTFRSGEFPDEGSHFFDGDDRFISYTGLAGGAEGLDDYNPVQVRFLGRESSGGPLIVRVGLSNTSAFYPSDGESAGTTKTLVSEDGPLLDYYAEPFDADEIDIFSGGVGDFEEPVTGVEGGVALIPLDHDFEERDGCWFAERGIETPGAVEFDLPEVDQAGEFSVYQDYALVSTDECLPKGIYEFSLLGRTPTPFERSFLLSIGGPRRRPQPSDSRFHGSVPGTIADGDAEYTLYHGVDSDELVFVEPESETLSWGNGEITFRCYSYWHQFLGFSAGKWWTLFEYTDYGWEELHWYKATGEFPAGSPNLLPNQYIELTLTATEGYPQVDGEPEYIPEPGEGGGRLPEHLTPGTYALVFRRNVEGGFAFEVEE